MASRICWIVKTGNVFRTVNLGYTKNMDRAFLYNSPHEMNLYGKERVVRVVVTVQELPFGNSRRKFTAERK